jgi:hypothetical protein
VGRDTWSKARFTLADAFGVRLRAQNHERAGSTQSTSKFVFRFNWQHTRRAAFRSAGVAAVHQPLLTRR